MPHLWQQQRLNYSGPQVHGILCWGFCCQYNKMALVYKLVTLCVLVKHWLSVFFYFKLGDLPSFLVGEVIKGILCL